MLLKLSRKKGEKEQRRHSGLEQDFCFFYNLYISYDVQMLTTDIHSNAIEMKMHNYLKAKSTWKEANMLALSANFVTKIMNKPGLETSWQP